ncbi:MAG: type II toxin-antitoxin system prevent-host-death family antitoxin [Spirochaetales bacterium]|jgi:antitoxin (DNA-binding transcriptional repressor) of toxin-antitoxin stability system|nr:type II toxin-antitoxin system prevent-host-death family antitoxin [Spirochaetales bacterium]
MKTIEVGAFDAKTHLSQLLDEVEKGAEVRISRRGKPVAVLRQEESLSRHNALEALVKIRELRSGSVNISEILEYRDDGRER